MFIAKPFLPNLKRRRRGMWLLASARLLSVPNTPLQQQGSRTLQTCMTQDSYARLKLSLKSTAAKSDFARLFERPAPLLLIPRGMTCF